MVPAIGLAFWALQVIDFICGQRGVPRFRRQAAPRPWKSPLWYRAPTDCV